jgi:ribosomal protein L7/L12
VVRERTGLKEPRISWTAPKAVKEKVAKPEAADMKKKLEEVGATVESNNLRDRVTQIEESRAAPLSH